MGNKASVYSGVYELGLTPRQLNEAGTFCSIIASIYDQGYKIIDFSVSWDEYQSFPHAGAYGIIVFGHSSARGLGQMWEYGGRKPSYGCAWVDRIAQSNYYPWAQI